MKNIRHLMLSAMLLLWASISFGQVGNITYPINGSVIQRDSSGNANITFSGSIGYGFDDPSKYNYHLILFSLDPITGEENNVGNVSFPLTLTKVPGTEVSVFNLYTNISEGWYESHIGITPKPGNAPLSNFYHKPHKFGVGDVFIIAGQSNARGFPDVWDTGLINFYSGISDSQLPDAARVIGNAERDGVVNFSEIENNEQTLVASALPMVKGFEKLTLNKKLNATNAQFQGNNIYDRPIFPTGLASWAWAPLGLKYVQSKGVPVQFFNTAIEGSKISGWQPGQSHYKRLLNLIKNQANITGFRGILWHQGESDAAESTSQIDYKAGLENMVNSIQTNFDSTATTWSALTWYISNVSYTTKYNSSFMGYDIFPSNSNITNAQSTSAFTTSVKKTGVSTDFIGETLRGPTQKIHFHDGTLNTVADLWNSAIVPDNNPKIPQTGLPSLVYSNNNNGTIQLNVQVSFPIAETKWVKNEDGLENPISTASSISVPVFSNEKTIYMAYIRPQGQNYWLITEPFIGPNLIDKQPFVSIDLIYQNTLSTNQQTEINVFCQNMTWVANVISGSSWISITNGTSGTSGSTKITTNISSNNSSSLRSGTIQITGTDVQNNTMTKTVTINQDPGIGSSGLADLNLTSLNPTNDSTQFGTISYSGLNAYGNGMAIGGQPYTQGIGTHAYSTISYNIPSGYNYFNGLVGRDDAGCNCGDASVNFKVKLNGNQVYESYPMGLNDDAAVFSIPLNGATQLELIVEPVNQNWGDVADWINPTLSLNASNSSGAPSPPTSVSASPASINSGSSSTLSATCSQGTVTWNTGATGSTYVVSPTATTTYDVKCVLNNNISTTQNVTVTVNGSGGSCAPATNLAAMGTWNVGNGYQLVTREFNGAKWLVQKANLNGAQYDEFVVRASEMLLRSDVTLTNSSYTNLVNCYAWQYSGYGGLVCPSATSSPAFPTPSGYYLYYASDGTPYYSNYVSGNYSCSNLSNNLFMGTWNVDNGYELRTKLFHNDEWLTQKINVHGSQWDEFVVRGSAMMQRSDVTLANSQFYNLTNCYGWEYSNYGNLAIPDANTFPTPSGYQKLLAGDQVTYYFTNWTSGARTGFVENVSSEELPFLSVSPNPSDGFFKLDVYLEKDVIINIALTDVTGKVVKDKSLLGGKGMNNIDFDATGNPPGMYIFNVNDGINQEVKKVVIK